MAGRPKGIAKTGGRKAGTPNKINSSATALMNQFGFDPLKGMMAIAMDKQVDVAIRARMFSELAQYVYAKRRAIEVSGPLGGAIQHEFTSARELLAARIAGIADRATAGSGTGESK
jgi:hypothetical protein